MADKTRTSRVTLRSMALLGGVVLLVSCGSSDWVPSEDATLITVPPDPRGQGRPSSAWAGELTLREGCVVEVGPTYVSVAVLQDGWTLVQHAETGEYAVRSDKGETFPLDTEYRGGGVALDNPGDLARFDGAQECADKLGTDEGTLIYTVEPKSASRETAPGSAPTN
jgi:hypothetical protein